ncbi:Oligopeptide transport ATP-binding protein OppF (TC 3.A.1.5.1) [hydrothermal vent metagenome]|uniref:Oligopeptide transport ATP-binding protein OppF (TC 3.A.1.5.1) n=1 Tax=hydrothermal vent metagenome TaxID=652676 RepID=A0A3B0U800_9ZZZZ
MPENTALLKIEDLKVHFPIRSGLFGAPLGYVRAVDGISFTINHGETFALVGESGCGKTSAGNAILRMNRPTGGRVVFDGTDMTELKGKALFDLRRHMQIIFQDPASSLNPKISIGKSVGEPLFVHEGLRGKKLKQRVGELLETVGLPRQQALRFPHQFSGGQRQRIVIARALALRPKLVVCDEPVSALDVSVQSQVLNLLNSLQRELGLAYLFISHDLSVVRHISDRVAVMYLGRIVELAATMDLFDNPAHPYTQTLIMAIPLPDPVAQRQRKKIIVEGEIPSPANPPRGCAFHTRCPLARDICRSERPALVERKPGHWVACHFEKARIDEPL